MVIRLVIGLITTPTKHKTTTTTRKGRITSRKAWRCHRAHSGKFRVYILAFFEGWTKLLIKLNN